MKLMVCNKCGDVIFPRGEAGIWKWCICGNIGGMYEDGLKFLVAIDDPDYARVVGIDNNVLVGNCDLGEIWKQKPGDPASGRNLKEISITEARRVYGYSGEASDTLVIDLAKVVGVVPSDSSPCFSEMVFHLVMKADRINRERLRAIFPIYVQMVDRFQLKDGVIAHPQHPEMGFYEPCGDKGYQWRYPLDTEISK